ncbi:MAG: magnesium/cobalt transporter CorA [Sedimentisphaerales bacterium]|nr:magnesium/cobalt transporter CorA [Sedimentisphaerales bacterium]
MAKTKQIRRHYKKAGLPPGTLIHIGERKMESVRITVIDYDENGFQEKQVSKIEDCFEFKKTPTVTWINIDGLHDVEIIEKIGNHYDFHPLVLEDILHTGQRPKFEDLENYLFIVLMMLRFDDDSQSIISEQVSLVLGRNFVISFQENVGDVFEQIRDRIRNAKGKIRKMGSDYLMYALLDAIVDSYFGILEKLGEKIESMEEELVSDPNEKTLKQIHVLKREMIYLRKSVWPLRELISGIERNESNLIQKATGAYLRDVYDHTIQVIDTVESFRDMVSGMLDIYLSSISNRMNAVMKVLTIIATIFIPLTFIAGIYGMNFKTDVSPWNMPELGWKWGYPAVLLLMLIVTGIMIYYFKKKKWL